MKEVIMLGGTLVRALLAPRVDLFDAVDVPVSVAGDFASLTSVMRLGRVTLLARLGLFGQAMREGWSTRVGAVQLDVLREARGRFTLSTRIVGWDAAWLYVEQRFERGGDAFAIARVKVQIERGGVSVTTAELLAEVGPWHASPQMPEAFTALFTRRAEHLDDLPGLAC